MTVKEKVKQKEYLHTLCQKHYGKGSKVKKENAKITKVIKEKKAIVSETSHQDVPSEATAKPVGIIDQPIKEGSRVALMQQAKEKGIKYFRILSKQELTDILKPSADQKYVDIVIEHARARWQSGWKANKQ